MLFGILLELYNFCLKPAQEFILANIFWGHKKKFVPTVDNQR